MPRTDISLVTTLLAAFLAGCGSETAADPDAVPTLVATEELRIGSVDDPETSLTFLTAIAIAPDGRIYSAHPQENVVRVFMPDGTPAGTIGGPGEGPGEFTFPSVIGFADDQVWVLDGRTSRISYFDAAGEFVRDVTFRPTAPADPRDLPPRPNAMLSDGTFLGSAGVISSRIADGEVSEVPIVRLRADGSIIDTVAFRPVGAGQISIRSDRGGTFTQHPFSDGPLTSVSPYTVEIVHVVRAVTDATPFISVTKRAITGDTLWARDVRVRPILLEAAVVDSFVADLSESVSERGMFTQNDAASQVRDQLVTPPYWAAVERLRLGRDGSVWLSMTDRDPAATRWIVISADGQLVGEVAFPARFLVLNARETEVWGVERDDLDIPYIVRYTVRPATPLEDVR